MGFNNNTLPGEVLDRVIMGLEGKDGALVDQVGQKIFVSDLSGTIPAIASKSLLARLEDAGLPEGAVAKDFDMEMENDSYALRRYVGKSYIADGTRIALDKYGLKTLSMYAMQCRRVAAGKLNKKLDTVLKDTGKNKQKTVSTAWTDAANSTPIKDMQDAMELCGYGDFAIFGRDVAEALVLTDDFKSRSHNFAAGGVTQAELVGQIRGLFPNLRKIIIGTNMFDLNAEGLPTNLGYQFDGLAFVGHERGLAVLEQQGAPESAQWRDEHREATGIRYTRRMDIVRVHEDLGCVFTGTI